MELKSKPARAWRPAAVMALTCLALPALGQSTDGRSTDAALPAVTVEGQRSVADRNQLPQTTESVNAKEIGASINAVNAEDTVKYLPSLLVRKRFIGDTNAPLASRTTGINASARTLIYADGILLSTLVNNNNANGSPQWFMVSPEDIDRVDVMYGPFAAAYPGNSYGAVAEIRTRMPSAFEAGAGITTSRQHFSQYGTDDDFPATQVHAYIGDRKGALSWRVSVNHLNSFSQPLTYLTIPRSSAPAGAAPPVSGAFADLNRSGGGIQVVGASNITHTVQDSAKLRLNYDIAPGLSAAYTLGYWHNDASANSQTYLANANGAPYYGGPGNVGIGGNAYSGAALGSLYASSSVQQEHWMQALSLASEGDGPWSWDATAATFRYGSDITRTSTGAYPAALAGGPGRIADAGGTGWNTFDVKGSWKQPGSPGSSTHQLRFGAHLDRYQLANPVWNTGDWIGGGNGAPFSDARGATRTAALWLQDAWRITPALTATLGGRQEWWRAFDGSNLATSGNASFPVTQPELSRSAFSPKLSLAWQAGGDWSQWSVTGSIARALRFPTVGELYQTVQTGTTFTQANPNLRPENVLAGELALQRESADSKLRISLFGERVSDALISQTSAIAGFALPVSFVQNVDRTRQRGIELAASTSRLPLRGLELGGSLTYVDARITANSSYVAAPATLGASSVGKRTPYVPAWRATALATWRPDDRWAWTLAGRYSSRVYATVDNTDVYPATYQGFESYAVADARVQYRHDHHWTLAAGIDNIGNRRYFLFHPFPQRTLYAELKYAY